MRSLPAVGRAQRKSLCGLAPLREEKKTSRNAAGYVAKESKNDGAQRREGAKKKTLCASAPLRE